METIPDDQQYAQVGTDYVPLYYEDQIVLIIRGPLALAAAEKLGEVLAELMKRPSGGRGNWNGGGKRKEGPEYGLFRTPPADLTHFEEGGTFKVPVIAYSYRSTTTRVIFYTPFDPQGVILDGKPGVEATSIQVGSKTWQKLFVTQAEDGSTKEWQFNPDGFAHQLPLRLATLCVGVDKDDPKKKFKFLVSVKPAPTTDPEALEYNDPPTAQGVTP